MGIKDLPKICQKRILPLLRNPKGGRNVLDVTESGEDVMSNCFGTLYYVLGFPEREDKSILTLLPGDKPGFLHYQVADAFYKKFEQTQDPEAGVIVGFVDEEGKLDHVGLMLNKYRFFNQWGHGGDYIISRLDRIEGVPAFYKVKFTKEAEERLSRKKRFK